MINFFKKLLGCKEEELQKEIDDLKEGINKDKKQNELEEYYNNKYPKSNITYKRTDKLGTIKIDVRQFLNKNNYMLPKFEGTDDEKALQSLQWVIKNIKYTPDKTEYGLLEYWAFNYETMNVKKGDCEDGAILLYCIMRNSGIPAWKIRLNAGNVTGGGHAYLVYYCEETEKWVVLDWCYWSNKLEIIDRKDYKDESNYQQIWFSWNEEYSWTKGLNTEADNLLNN